MNGKALSHCLTACFYSLRQPPHHLGPHNPPGPFSPP